MPEQKFKHALHAAVAALAFIALARVTHAADEAAAVDVPNTLRYDTEYPVIGYQREPKDNAVARLQQRLQSGEIKLQFAAPRGYLESLLRALSIDPNSQSLVYSRTSLQAGAIRAVTPRALYFNDETYVGWVQGSAELEIATMDRTLGQVFYVLPNRDPADTPALQRETLRCLACHDTYSLSGGGVPRFLLMSQYTAVSGRELVHEGSILATDQTPMRFRFGGWYVTGRHGDQVHLGNMQVRAAQELTDLESLRRGNLDTLSGLFDTTPYLTDKSDIVAQLVLLHQVTIQNLITRANFELRTAYAKESPGGGKAGPATAAAMKQFLEPLLQAMLFVEAAPYTSPISGGSGFDATFQRRGPRDGKGRSLRDLDLRTRLFRYPLSYLVYSESFAALPDYARRYLYSRFNAVLQGKDRSGSLAALGAEDRKAVLEILTATKPEFAAR